MIGRTNAGGGGTGGELTVNAPAGVKVIATNSETGKSYTRTANADGVAVFKGLPEGMYNVTITDGERTSDPVPAKVVYKSGTTIDFFQATIEITYPAESTCVVTDSNGETVASDTNADSEAKTWTAMVFAADTYTVTATSSDGSYTHSNSVSIDTHGQSSSVTITFWPDTLYLYNAGDLCTEYTGGWTKYNESGGAISVSNSGGVLYLVAPAGVIGTYSTTNTIDLSYYSTLYITVTSTTVTSNQNRFYGGVSPNRGSNSFAAGVSLYNGGTKTVDVSSIDEELYINILIHSAAEGKISKIWLTR